MEENGLSLPTIAYLVASTPTHKAALLWGHGVPSYISCESRLPNQLIPSCTWGQNLNLLSLLSTKH